MQTLDPKQSLEQLITRRLEYERARGDRTAEGRALQVAINRAESECGNLVHHIEHDYELRHLHGQLLGELEMGKAVLQQAATAPR
jgi:hypothetical protein